MSQTATTEFLDFLNKSRSSFAAVQTSATLLVTDGFVQLDEATPEWKLKKGGKYFFTRNQTSVIAFAIGEKYEPGNGFGIAAAHSDSPCLKIKPNSNVVKGGAVQIGVETYGGGLWHTWFDRDLGLSGRVIVKEKGKFVSRFVAIHRPILRISSLAIHLDRSVSEGFKFNNEDQLLPVLASQIKADLEAPVAGADASKTHLQGEHHPLLLTVLSKELNVPVSDLHSFELTLCDVQDSCLGGALNEFVFSGRLDNLGMGFVCLKSLLNYAKPEKLKDSANVSVAILFDNEEIGSNSTMGADSTLLEDVIYRVSETFSKKTSTTTNAVSLRNSFLLSCDMAHALHPNYQGKHEGNHRPMMHAGPVLKFNANQRYATSGESALIIKEVAAKAGVALQSFVVRNDSPCGSTIGPILASRLGLRCCDIGVPQLSMHSIRETAAASDFVSGIALVEQFFAGYQAVSDSFKPDAPQ